MPIKWRVAFNDSFDSRINYWTIDIRTKKARPKYAGRAFAKIKQV